MSTAYSLDEVVDGLNNFVSSIKAASRCSKAGEVILKLKENVESLSTDAEKTSLNDSDFLAYKKELRVCVQTLIGLEEPGNEMKENAIALKSLLDDVIKQKQLSRENFSKLKDTLMSMFSTAKDFGRGVNEFQCRMEMVRKFCENALKHAAEEEKKLQEQASGKLKTGIIKGVGAGGLGAAALALGILGICTGGVGFVVAGVAGTAIGGASIAGGAAAAASDILSANEIDKKAATLRDAVNGIERALSGVGALEKNMKANDGIIELKGDALKSLEAGLVFFGKMKDDAKDKEQLQSEVTTLKDENEELKRQLEELNLKMSKAK